MSSHYIYLRCPAPGCTAVGEAYTGDVYVDRFEEACDYEGAWIDARCDEHADYVPEGGAR